MKKLKILVVDDSLITVKKLAAMLTQMGHQVVRTAATGKEALEAYKECTPDLVTMDITMPDMDGIKSTRLIRSRFPEAVIVMVTSHGQEKMVLDALKAGAKGYLLKPFKQDKLQELVDSMIKRFYPQGEEISDVPETEEAAAQEATAQEEATEAPVDPVIAETGNTTA